MLTINNLEVNYGKEIALSIKSKITFEDGDRIGIIGANGAGKTTLVKAILGIVKYNGSIHTNLLPEQMSAHMQENNYVVTMKIKYIIEAILGCSIKNNEKLKELIKFFNFEGCLNKKYSNLSGGQKQRLTIILVLIQDSPLVFFDEVTSGLDFETRNQLMEKISEWYKNKNSTVCIVSHYYEELERLANKILILDKGKVVDFGVKEELFKKYCGNSVIIIQNDTIEDNLTKKFTKIEAPENLIAISCQSKENELEIINILASNNINFKRSNNDIEIMVMNAKESSNKLNHYKKL
ncbi:ABC transporter ATP-binding protein [Clostridium gasigenes]|uniref:ATP-binding cassette domain-containing protein n=1 Tax=Clostridium gasigenes TaxID=94869 RepID=UPI0014382F1F|nr:ABC transporter ATP-binding protein [Clostridium gasigenes]NKF07483.1 ABC transporter ATP-binding protein [Clostridium gasigenes]QSW17922.1 ABC transporter ATP-binding protein [Clostridium gasigenes]